MNKIKGTGFHFNKEPFLYTFYKNTVYKYSFPELDKVGIFKSLSNISAIRISNDSRKLAVLNTAGTIAVHDSHSGELIGKNRMEHAEGDSIYFINDSSQQILFSDWSGKIMLLNTDTCKHEVMYDFNNSKRQEIIYAYYHPYKHKIIAIEDCTKNVYLSDSSTFNFEKRQLDTDYYLNSSHFFVYKNLYVNIIWTGKSDTAVFFNYKLEPIKTITFPDGYFCKCLCVSQDEDLIFAGLKEYGYDDGFLYSLEGNITIKRKYDIDNLSESEFAFDDKYLLIAAWGGVYVDEV